MIYIDLALLDLIESLCRRFQILTGRTNVWLAFQLTNLSIVVYFIWAGVYFWTIPWYRTAGAGALLRRRVVRADPDDLQGHDRDV